MTQRDREVVRFSAVPSADDMLRGYTKGEFVMPFFGDAVYQWMSPAQRGVLPLDGLRVTRSLRKSCKHYEVTFDEAFPAVLYQCADPQREGAWINRPLARAYLELHDRGYAHSVETWTSDGLLAGGLFLVNIGGLVSGESMFHVGRDASKVALVALVERLRQDGGPILLDTQWATEHLATLGVLTMSRRQYQDLLPSVIHRPQAL